MALELNLTKNTNEQLEGTLGKYYARVEYKGTIGIKELAAHMHQHNTAFSKGIVMGVLGDMVDCIKHLVLDGYTVKIDDLGIFKASVEANGLTLEKGAKISAGRGAQRTDEELQANPAAQQFAVGDVKIIMQATGNTVIDKMNADAKLSFTSKTKAMVKNLTGSDATDDNSGNTNGGGSSNTNGTNPTNGGDNSGGGSSNQTLASPTISGNTSFSESTQVTISGPDGAAIHYTTDGSTPTAESTVYSEAITLSATTTVKAIAIKNGQSSEVASRVFTKSSNDDGMGQD
jgi:predicted histone-like DNA-binding protein